ncbi:MULTISPECIES: glucose 1-dehydrogenase [unclassified Afipia]|uniref:SDR family NAD(P)-dependent oxidoreductase n=1 Tax=unclassified Afipia TaxID=2642050 RepID=UPI0003F9397A|nr:MULTISPECIES: glucose 1-dehydrogenase [unclassified Afipia]
MQKSPFDLTGKIAIVTGGNGGIGLGMARGLARAGAGIVIAGRNKDKSEEAVRDIEALGASALAVSVDVTDIASVGAMVEATLAQMGRIDILINNAGMSVRQPAHALSLDDWQTVMNTNLTSAFICAKAVYPAMKQAGGGKIINIGSMTSIFGAAYAPAYAASKGGIVQFTKSIALSWAADNIQANAILPGWIDTALTRTARAQVSGLNENVLNRTPAKRWGNIDDLAGAAVFLASPASDFVTGTAIPVDGGYSVQ